MRSTFGGIETALRAVRAQRLALDLTGHNIANVDTPGYSRQVARTWATDPYSVPTMNRNTVAGQIGTGVETSKIERMRDAFIDRQLQYENSSLGWWTTRQSGLEQIEVIFQEPSETGLAAQLSKFWESLEELGNRPSNDDDISVRTAVLETAESLACTISDTYKQLQNFQKNLDQQARILVDRVNSLAKQIAQVNSEIVQVVGVGQEPNDLLDKRELLVQELSEITDINVQTDDLNSMTISLGGTLLVSGDTSYDLSVVDNATTGFADIITTINGGAVDVNNGKLGAILKMRDNDLQYYIDSLNDFAGTLITEFNNVHNGGYDLYGNNPSMDFFGGTDASDIGVLITDPKNIAASASGAVGDGTNAFALAEVLKDRTHAGVGGTTLSGFYGQVIAKLGVDANQADTALENQTLLVGHLYNRQQSVAGVSLDEEMANMIKFQNSYNAAARIMTTLDETLDKLINGMGTVGR